MHYESMGSCHHGCFYPYIRLVIFSHPSRIKSEPFGIQAESIRIQMINCPSEAKGRGFDPRQPHQLDFFPDF
jgi:hypothetical protein